MQKLFINIGDRDGKSETYGVVNTSKNFPNDIEDRNLQIPFKLIFIKGFLKMFVNL